MKIKYSGRNSDGFVALFFVLSFATALGMLVFGLTQKSQYMLSLLRAVRDSHNAKSAIQFCLQRLIDLKSLNIGYIPPLDTDISTFGGFVCTYRSFSEEAVADEKQLSIKQRGVVRSVQAIRKFSVEVTSGRTGDQDVTPAEPLYRVRREYYITDAI